MLSLSQPHGLMDFEKSMQSVFLRRRGEGQGAGLTLEPLHLSVFLGGVAPPSLGGLAEGLVNMKFTDDGNLTPAGRRSPSQNPIHLGGMTGMALQKRWQRPVSRRDALVAGALGGAATAFGLPLVTAGRASAAGDKAGDIKILNTALFYEHQAIWAYGAAAGRLRGGDVGRAVLMIAQTDRADHEQHRDTLAAAVRQLGGTPVGPQPSYDLSDYIRKGEGNLDSDVNIAKLALAVHGNPGFSGQQTC